MAVTHSFSAPPEKYFQQIEKVIKSHSLRGSESLCKLLRYLAKQSLDHPNLPLKEYQIATEVYGRSSDFDPQSDSTIRVQAGRLRMKLAEYYASEGAADSIVVKIPKGNYHLVFESRAVAPELHLASSTASSDPSAPAINSRWRMASIALLFVVAVLVAILSILFWNRKQSAGLAPPSPVRAVGPIADFWKPFAAGDEEPWVIFSNAAFVGRPETGMRYFNSRQDAKSNVYDHYTGVGEVLAIHALDDAFDSLGRRIRVKRGSLFTLDDVKNNNLIFVGSPSENLSLLDIPGTQEFVFQRVLSGSRKGDLSIINKHPAKGESDAYLASPSSNDLTEDYALVGLIPGTETGRFVMILAGTTTFGTEGVVDFACHQESVEKLLHKIPGANAGQVKPFEALVRVKIARGVPVGAELVAVRAR